MREYELMFVVDPRLSDDEVVTMSQEYADMLTAGGAEITKQESWGKRKLAYQIQKLTEGRYMLFKIELDGTVNPFPEVEQRMQQNENILRFLTVRTDSGRLRLPEEKQEPAVVEKEAG